MKDYKMSMIVHLPKELRGLQQPWFGEGVPQTFQDWLRFGSKPFMQGGKPYIMKYYSGGGGTMQWSRVDEVVYKGFEALTKREGFPDEFDPATERDLGELLADRGVSLKIDKDLSSIKKGIFDSTRDIYSMLPAHHFGHKHFTELELGNWGGGSAKCSEYADPKVHMFTFATEGPRRNYNCLLLHETGHAHFEYLKESEKRLSDGINECFQGLRQASRLFAADYLWGEGSRVSNYITTQNPDEFAAEFYLFYVTQGDRFKGFLSSLPIKERLLWEKTYRIFKESFNGVEYK